MHPNVERPSHARSANRAVAASSRVTPAPIAYDCASHAHASATLASQFDCNGRHVGTSPNAAVPNAQQEVPVRHSPVAHAEEDVVFGVAARTGGAEDEAPLDSQLSVHEAISEVAVDSWAEAQCVVISASRRSVGRCIAREYATRSG